MAWPKGKPRSPETLAKMSQARRSLSDRYWAKVDKRGPAECWPWTASLTPSGYGQIGVHGQRRPEPAHRVAYALAYGPIPADAVVDHACHNQDPTCPGGPCTHRACQNPAHLQLNTQGGNVLAGKTLSALNAVKTDCPAGHPYDAANTYLRSDGGGRDCRKCRAAAEARRRNRVGNTCAACSKPISPQSRHCRAHMRNRWGNG